MHRNTYVEINLSNITNNVKKIINKLSGFKYYFGVVKADCYGHNNIETVNAIINGGCNYLTVATLDEALEIRKFNTSIPILCLGIIKVNDLDIAQQNNITITINRLDYLIEVLNNYHKELKCHIKINTGMNRLGVKDKREFNEMYKLISNSNLYLEGLYTHIYCPDNKELTYNQYDLFENITNDINLNEIDIVHVSASEATINYRADFANGCRLGIIMYGLLDTNIDLESTFSLYSEVIQINELEPGETLGYNANYKADKKTRIAVIPIGYADGIIRKNTGRYIYINDKKYNIVGNICMDMLYIEIDETIKVGDKVTIIKDIDHINYIADYLDTINYEIICSISKRVPRIYK